MTTIYFVRHAQPDTSGGVNPEFTLTEQGKNDAEIVAGILYNRGITKIYSSSYIRAVQTVESFAESEKLEIIKEYDLRERTGGDWSKTDPTYTDYIFRQIDDFSHKAPNGESMNDVQNRTMPVIKRILSENESGTVVVATHGMALASVLKYYFPKFSAKDFEKIIKLMPFVLRTEFENGTIINYEIELAIRRVYPNNYI